MRVAMVNIGIVRMAVRQLLMPMDVRMWFARRILRSMAVLMMFVVPMKMLMCHRLMMMQMGMLLCKMKPDPCNH